MLPLLHVDNEHWDTGAEFLSLIFAVFCLNCRLSADSTNWFHSGFMKLHSRKTCTHIANRWTVSGGTIAPVSTPRPQEPPTILPVHPGCLRPVRGSAGWVCASCRLCQTGWDDWWLFWFPILIHPSSVGSWETMGSSCWTQTSPSDFTALWFRSCWQSDQWITSYILYLPASCLHDVFYAMFCVYSSKGDETTSRPSCHGCTVCLWPVC